jgi:biotin operon repressor
MLNLLKQNLGKEVSRENLASVANILDWSRTLRSLRQSGWEIETTPHGYILHSLQMNNSGNKREQISSKLRYQVLSRDESKCQRCGRTPDDGVKLHVDHKVPVDWGGSNDLDNLWTLCDDCNGGKKNFFSDDDSEKMKRILKSDSGYQRLVNLFEENPNTFISSSKISVVAGIQDWPRTIRDIRARKNMNIQSEINKGERGYIYLP